MDFISFDWNESMNTEYIIIGTKFHFLINSLFFLRLLSHNPNQIKYYINTNKFKKS